MNRFRHRTQRANREHTQQRPHFFHTQRFAAAGNGLIKRRKRIAHAAFARMRDHREHFVARLNAFFFDDVPHAVHHFHKINRAETEMLAARSNGVRNFVRFRGAQNKNHPLRRLFQAFSTAR